MFGDIRSQMQQTFAQARHQPGLSNSTTGTLALVQWAAMGNDLRAHDASPEYPDFIDDEIGHSEPRDS